VRRIKAGKSPFSSDKEHLHHRIMRAGNTQQRTAFIMYLWTATIAFPVTVLAFAPTWVAAIVAASLLLFTVIFSRGKSKMYKEGRSESVGVHVE
jgi:UDP-GlcNAc:undecaprenyl-phosphate GlcNAc-1-phosphate transferase